MKKIEYPFTIRRLSKAEGGGWLVEFPDLPGCIADGETIEEAVGAGSDALRSWLATAKEFKDPISALGGVKWEMGPAGSEKPSRQACRKSRERRSKLEYPGRISHRRRNGPPSELKMSAIRVFTYMPINSRSPCQ